MIISIVIPVYNAENYLERAINSVLNQTDQNWELILVDDGSTDRSGMICDYYSERYQNIFAFHKENEGQFLTRQFGIQKASGDYIGFLDADDKIKKNYIETVLDSINHYNNPNVICFGFDEFIGNQKKERLISTSSTLIIDASEVLNDILSNKMSGSMCTKVFKVDLLENTFVDFSYVSTKRYGEDALHSFSILLKSKSVLYLDIPLYDYLRNDDGASVGFENRDFEYFNTKYVWQMLLEYIKSGDIDSSNKLYANNFNESIFYILCYYRSAKSSERRQEIVNHDWSTYLLEMTDEDIKNNPYVRKSYIKVWNAFKNKRHLEIFIREKIKKIGWG